MKAVLLAAGLGTRLRPITLTTPKCLVPFDDIPLLEIWLRQFEAAGISEVLVNLHHFPEQVQAFVDGRRGRIRVSTVLEETLLGSLGTLVNNRKFYENEDELFVAYADNLVAARQANLVEVHSRHDLPLTMAVFQTNTPSQCGIVESDEHGVVHSFVEKPEHPASDLANGGLYVLDTSILLDIEDDGTRPLDIGFHLLPKLIGRMVAVPYGGYLQDVGTLERYESAQRYFREHHGEFI